jgi:hypothetical protein
VPSETQMYPPGRFLSTPRSLLFEALRRPGHRGEGQATAAAAHRNPVRRMRKHQVKPLPPGEVRNLRKPRRKDRCDI